MKYTKITPRILLGMSLLGAFVVAPLATPTAQADPPKNAPAYGRRAKDNGTKYKKDKKDKKDRRDDRDDRNNSTFIGIVTDVHSGNSFDLSANGRTYNVYTSTSLPHSLSRGDEVRVYGRPHGNNDIRNASVRVTDNNRNDPRRDDRDDNKDNNGYGSARTYRGTVTKVRSNNEFDVLIDNRTYNVYASSSASGLSRGDEVRIYGRPYGTNDIRNASVHITRNR